MSTRQFKRLAHSLYECKYHIVFCPKYRYKILKNDVSRIFKRANISIDVVKKDGIEVHELNIQEDHVHLFLTIPPKYAVSEIMGFLKGKARSKNV